MTVPLIGLGHGLTLPQLVEFIVEPAIPNGVMQAQRDHGLDMTIYEQGSFCVLQWGVIDGKEDFDALLTQMGLEEDSDTRAAVSAYLPTKRGNWHVYDCYANIPQEINYFLFFTDLRVLLNDLVQTG